MNEAENGQTKILEVVNTKKYFYRVRGLRRKILGIVKAVDNVNLFVRKGETLALVGESGSGKTTLGRTILRAYEPTDGHILFNMNGNGGKIDLAHLTKRELKEIRKDMAMIFQDPYSSLNPRLSVLEIVGEPFRNYNMISSRSDLESRVSDLLRNVRLDPEYMKRYPHAFSGGQRQRIAIARALALHPKFIVADEPVSALDVSVQAQILLLMRELQAEFHLTYLFIAHNLGVIEYISNRIAVMYVGKIVELADTAELFDNPKNPYTEALLSAVPKPDPKYKKKRIILKGDIADPANPPSGCYFHPRCRYAKDICKDQEPPLVDILDDESHPHFSACHFSKELSLSGIA